MSCLSHPVMKKLAEALDLFYSPPTPSTFENVRRNHGGFFLLFRCHYARADVSEFADYKFFLEVEWRRAKFHTASKLIEYLIAKYPMTPSQIIRLTAILEEEKNGKGKDYLSRRSSIHNG